AVVSNSTSGFAAKAAVPNSASAAATIRDKARGIEWLLLLGFVGLQRFADQLELRGNRPVALVERSRLFVFDFRKPRIDVAEVLVRDRVIGRNLDGALQLVARERIFA